MSDLRTAAQQALTLLELISQATTKQFGVPLEIVDALKAALAEDVATHGSAWSKDGKRIDPMSVYAEPVQGPAELPLEEVLSKAYYYTEDGRWRGLDVRDWDRWHAVAKVAVALTRRAALAEPVQESDPDPWGAGYEAGYAAGMQECQAEPVQKPLAEPVAYSIGRTLHWHQGRGVTDAQLYIVPPQRPTEPVQQGCDHCNSPLYAARKCRVCGRVTSEHLTPGSEHLTPGSEQMAEPVQEPYAWMSVGGSIWRHKTTEDDVPLYTAPRTPLAEWQINDLMSDIDPEDRDSWSFRQGVYAAEKHHGVRR